MRVRIVAPVLLVLCVCLVPNRAGADDVAMVERLETAVDKREVSLAFTALAKRMSEPPPLSDALILRVLTKAASDPYLASYRLDALLQQLDPSYLERGDVIEILSDGLTSEGIFRVSDRAQTAMSTLVAYQQRYRLSEHAYRSLIAALDNRAMSNREIAIRVLAAAAPTDERYATIAGALADTLRGHDHQSTRSAAAKGLAIMAGKRALRTDELAALEHAATADPYLTVRMDALEAFSSRSLTPERRDEMTRSLASVLTQRNPDLWKRSRGLSHHTTLEPRAEAILDSWYHPPYPPHVVDAFIALNANSRLERSAAILNGVRQRGELSDAQRQTMLHIAERSGWAQVRARTYAVLAEIGSDRDVAAAAHALRGPEPSALRAAYGLLARFEDDALPAQVADSARDVMMTTPHAELRAAVAGLVARGPADRAQRESELIEGVRNQDSSADGIAQSLFALYGDDGIEALVVRYVTDATLSPLFRSVLVQRLEKVGDRSTDLRADTLDALAAAGSASRNYWLLAAIARVYAARGLDLPLGLYLKQRSTHHLALTLGWLACAVLNLIAGALSLYFVLAIGSERRNFKWQTAGLLVVWLLFVIAALAAAAIGVFSALSHGSSPAPASVLRGNIPFYVVTLASLAFSALLWTGVRKDQL